MFRAYNRERKTRNKVKINLLNAVGCGGVVRNGMVRKVWIGLSLVELRHYLNIGPNPLSNTLQYNIQINPISRRCRLGSVSPQSPSFFNFKLIWVVTFSPTSKLDSILDGVTLFGIQINPRSNENLMRIWAGVLPVSLAMALTTGSSMSLGSSSLILYNHDYGIRRNLAMRMTYFFRYSS